MAIRFTGQQHSGVVGLALGTAALLQADPTIPQQLVRHMGIQPLAQTLEESVVLPQHETARVGFAEPALFTLHNICTAVGADTNDFVFHKRM